MIVPVIKRPNLFCILLGFRSRDEGDANCHKMVYQTSGLDFKKAEIY